MTSGNSSLPLGDYIDMICEQYREALSARLDGEVTDVEAALAADGAHREPSAPAELSGSVSPNSCAVWYPAGPNRTRERHQPRSAWLAWLGVARLGVARRWLVAHPDAGRRRPEAGRRRPAPA